MQCGQGNDVLRSEINRWDTNHIDVSMLLTRNSKMRKELEELGQELQESKDRCTHLAQDNQRLRNKIAEAENKEIEQLYGNVGSGIETRHVEGNDDDEDVHEAINCNLIDSGKVDTKQLIFSDDTLPDKTSLGWSEDILVNSAKETVEVTPNASGNDREEVKSLDTPALHTVSGIEKHATDKVRQQLSGHSLGFTNLSTEGKEITNSIRSEDFDSGTLMRDASQEETVLVEAVKIRIDPLQVKNSDDNTHSKTNSAFGKTSLPEDMDVCSPTVQNKAASPAKYNSDVSARKSERKLPKIPLESNGELHTDISQINFSFGRYPPTCQVRQTSVDRGNVEEELKNDAHYGTIDTVSTKSFGFSRPSDTFIRREIEQGMMQYKTYFKEVNGKVEKKSSPFTAKRYSNKSKEPDYRARTNQNEKERKSLLSRSKSMDMNHIPSDTDKRQPEKVSIGRTFSNVDKYQGGPHVHDLYGQQADWRRNTPFAKGRRRGRSENRTRWGIDGTGTLLMGTKQNMQNHSQMNQVFNTVYIPSHTTQQGPAQARTTCRRPSSSDRTTSPTPSQVSTNTVIRVRQSPCNILNQEAGLY